MFPKHTEAIERECEFAFDECVLLYVDQKIFFAWTSLFVIHMTSFTFYITVNPISAVDVKLNEKIIYLSLHPQ